MNEELRELIEYRLARTRETLEEAGSLGSSNHWHGCVNRTYYACFYAVQALLAARGLSSSKHTGVRALFNRHYVKPGGFPKELGALYNDLFQHRQQGDYEDFWTTDPQEVRPWLEQAEDFLREVDALLRHILEKES